MSEPLLALRDLNAWYGEGHALHGVDLDVFAGETVTLLGRNGVGKTTTLRAVMGLIRKRTGTASFDGKDLLRMPLHHVARAGIGFVPEERGIFSTLSVEENLHLPPVVAPGGMSVDEIFALFPNLKARRSSQGTKLSGGEQQMLAMGRAMMARPELLLLDEPSMGLSPIMVDTLFDTIGDITRRGVSVLLVEQNATRALEIAQRGYVMDSGEITVHGAAADLLNDPRIQQAYLGL